MDLTAAVKAQIVREFATNPENPIQDPGKIPELAKLVNKRVEDHLNKPHLTYQAVVNTHLGSGKHPELAEAYADYGFGLIDKKKLKAIENKHLILAKKQAAADVAELEAALDSAKKK
jgi:hypothetical protein